MRRMSMIAAALLGLGATFPAAAQTAAESTAPAGTYHIDPTETHILYKINHLGFSSSIALFTRFTGELHFDPLNPEAMTLAASVDLTSLETNYPDPKTDFNAIITGPDLLDAKQFPTMTFDSTKVALTGPFSAEVTGDLTLHGVTRPLTLQVTFNGGYAPNDMDPGGARIGFSAIGSLMRSEFGVDMGIPEPGTTMGIGDKVDIIIEAEFLNPDAP
ncbi:MAG: YceI family protein [bacterium]